MEIGLYIHIPFCHKICNYCDFPKRVSNLFWMEKYINSLIIEFENRVTEEKIEVKVLKLYKYDSFEELYKHFDKVSMGYASDEDANPIDMEKYYSKEEQANYGVIGIEMSLIK